MGKIDHMLYFSQYFLHFENSKAWWEQRVGEIDLSMTSSIRELIEDSALFGLCLYVDDIL